MSGDCERLSRALDALGWNWRMLEDDRCGRIVVAERGARVLGLFAGGDGPNGVWVNPRLFESSPGDWTSDWNAGGDRTWVAPEVKFFIDQTGGQRVYGVQGGLDPGRYELIRSDETSCSFLQSTGIKDHELGEYVQVSVEREIELAPSPFHEMGEGPWSEGGVRYAGYQLRVTLRVDDVYTRPVGIWNLLQVPAPGAMFVPTWYPVRPTVVFGDDRPVLSSLEGGVRFAVDGENQCKVSIPAAAAVGRMGFRTQASDGSASLIVRSFFVNPSGDYVDEPWDAPGDRGYAVQCYGDDGQIGAFGEMEHHAPAIPAKREGESGGARFRTDVSQTWYFHGPAGVVDAIARRLLGPGAAF